MSIKEIALKIKDYAKNCAVDEHFFIAFLIIAVGVTSYGLGRLSTLSGDQRVGEDRRFFIEHNDQIFDSAAVSGASVTVERGDPSVTEGSAGQTLATEGLYVASKNSDKYHLPWCSGTKRIKEENKIWFSSKEEAEKAGYKPAGNCKGI